LEPQAERWAAAKANLKPGTAPSLTRVPAQTAYDCLMSVFIDVEGDPKEIDELKAFLQWQSTLAWLQTDKVLTLLVFQACTDVFRKYIGVEDIIDPQDLMANLDSLASAVKSKTSLKSDYKVQLSIRKMLDDKHSSVASGARTSSVCTSR
jgi:hypothetical protein